MEIKVSRKFFHDFIMSTSPEDLIKFIDMPMFIVDGEEEELAEIKEKSICPFVPENNQVTLKSFINGFIIPLSNKVFVSFEPQEKPGAIECDVVDKWWDNDEQQ